MGLTITVTYLSPSYDSVNATVNNGVTYNGDGGPISYLIRIIITTPGQYTVTSMYPSCAGMSIHPLVCSIFDYARTWLNSGSHGRMKCTILGESQFSSPSLSLLKFVMWLPSGPPCGRFQRTQWSLNAWSFGRWNLLMKPTRFNEFWEKRLGG